ncbi:extracellular solute-binding protein [Paenibacillus alginolyticus]|uniref:extracellular solute-binding protein n=1 Tax=Paenibacillus alginolyticus TaxID=59839 RepID=UPI0028ACA4B2|nr:extracellular solute-binding protein [Paenibacillus frigoriresistens]
MNLKWMKWSVISLTSVMLLAGCQTNTDQAAPKESGQASTPNNAGKPATWIADRTIKGRLFLSSGDVSKDINPEIAKKLKDMTGITLELEGANAQKSIDGLTAGLASGDLPDFIVYNLNNSGRPEMTLILKAGREGMFTDLTPLIKNTKIYSKYLQDKYLPIDTQFGVMFRPEFQGSTYSMHMNIPREGGYQETKYVGGPYIRKDIVDALGIDPKSIKTSDQLYELAKKIKASGFKDKNGKEVYPIGPRYWGGREMGGLYNDLVWGADEQRIHQGKDGKILHESQTEYPMKRIAFVQKLLGEKLMVPEYYTMEETRATEGIINDSYAIVAEMHNFLDFNKDAHYVPLGPLNSVDGPYQMQIDYKTGYRAWSIPKTTKNPEDIVKFADFLASREGKLLWQYGIEGRDYTLDAKGNPIVKKEVLDLKKKDPKAAAALGFDGVGNAWGGYLGSTDLNRKGDFNETQYGDTASPETNAGPYKILDMWGYEEKLKNAKLNDGYQPLAFLGEFEQGTQLKEALKKYDDSMIRAFYAKSSDEAKKIIDAASAQLKASGLEKYEELLAKKNADPKTKVILN